MNLGRLSINQPILAMVLSIVLLIVGTLAYQTLPIAEYPEVVPPTVVVTAQYPGASAQTISDTVSAPIEQQINGVEDILYMYSQSTSNVQLTITITFNGRLTDLSQFEDIVVKAGADGRIVRLHDVARVELGALDYSTNSFELRKTAVALLVTQRPGSNALATAKGISDTMVKLKASFPKGLDYNIGYNPTEFIAQSVHELIKTIYEAMLLVVIVVLVFLQGWRPAIIPIVAIPVSLVGTFAAMSALGFAINNLTLMVCAMNSVGL